MSISNYFRQINYVLYALIVFDMRYLVGKFVCCSYEEFYLWNRTVKDLGGFEVGFCNCINSIYRVLSWMMDSRVQVFLLVISIQILLVAAQTNEDCKFSFYVQVFMFLISLDQVFDYMCIRKLQCLFFAFPFLG